MSKIMDLMKDKDAVLVFDVDGVLAAYICKSILFT